MKQITKRLVLLGIVSLALTSCELSFNPFDFSGWGNSNTSSDTSDDTSSNGDNTSSSEDGSSSSNGGASSTSSGNSTNSSSSTSSSSSSSSAQPVLPDPDELTATKPSSTYMNISQNNPSGKASTPSVNKAKLLVIPVWFENDSANYINESKKEDLKKDIETAYFGTNEETGWRSVKTYYEEESHGALTISGTVSDWYTETRSVSQFASESNGSSMTKSLASTASNWYFNNNPSESRSDYDLDSDGYLDGVMLIYAYPDYSALGNYSYRNLWAYCFWVAGNNASYLSPKANQYFWASYDFMFSYGTAAEHTGKSRRGSGHTDHCNIDAHTYIHEMGHMFGLDDYYDYSQQYNSAGGFSMQDHNIGGHDAYSVLALGWGEAYIPTETVTINLKPMQSSGEMILLTPEWNEHNSPFDEYLLLEYYTPTGLNEFDTNYRYGNYVQGPNTRGIRLWHVDARLTSYRGSYTFSGLLTNPNDKTGYGVVTAMTNTYDGNGVSSGYLSPLGSEYYNFNLLQLIHNDKTIDNSASKRNLSAESLFKTNDTFDMSSYGDQFYRNGKLNSNSDLGFTFTVNGFTDEFASITVTKI